MNLKPATQEIFTTYSKLKDSGIGVDKFIADSSRVVLKLLQTDIHIHSLLATSEWIEEHKNYLSRVPEIYFSDAQEMQNIVGYSLHQGVMCLAQRPADSSIEDMMGEPIVILNTIAKADNVGAIIRNAAAFGFKNILIDSSTVHPYNRRAVRTSMGNVYGLRIHQTSDLLNSIKVLMDHNYQIVGFENRPHAISLNEMAFKRECGFVIGSEAIGIEKNITEIIPQLIKIPIDQEVFALNAACASAVAMYGISQSLESNKA